MGHIISQIAGEITWATTGEATGAIAGRMSRYMAPAATCPVPDRMPCQTTDEGLRTVTAETIRQTMSEITLSTKD
jgi:hypothetical protein